jgi:hypothetical protein
LDPSVDLRVFDLLLQLLYARGFLLEPDLLVEVRDELLPLPLLPREVILARVRAQRVEADVIRRRRDP